MSERFEHFASTLTQRRLRHITPDLEMNVPTSYHEEGIFQGGGIFLGEVKTINPGRCYDRADVRHGRARAVQVREQQLPGHYEAAALTKDREWFGVTQPEVGPMRTVLRRHRFAGLVVGHVGEASNGLKAFVAMMADTAAERKGRITGAKTRKQAASVLGTRFMVQLSIASWRGRADLVIDRARYVGVPSYPASSQEGMEEHFVSFDSQMRDAAHVDNQGPVFCHLGGQE